MLGGVMAMRLVDENVGLWRGPRPTSLGEVKALGIRRIINLESGFYQALSTEEGLVSNEYPPDFGLVEYNIPCSDIRPPGEFVIEKVMGLCRDRTPTLIHCLSGVDRTGFVCASYRVKALGWSVAAAIAEFRAFGRHPWFWWWDMELKKRYS